MKYELTHERSPDISLLITADHKWILDTLCDIEFSNGGNKVYILNKQRFTILPHIIIKTDAELKAEEEREIQARMAWVRNHIGVIEVQSPYNGKFQWGTEEFWKFCSTT